MTDLDTRLALAGIIAETRAIMTRSADQARRGTSRREIIARLIAATDSVPLALPAPELVTIAPVAPVSIDLTGVNPFTERALSEITGVSLACISKAITAKKIRTTKIKGRPRLLDVASTSRWLQREHCMDPTMLLDINQE